MGKGGEGGWQVGGQRQNKTGWPSLPPVATCEENIPRAESTTATGTMATLTAPPTPIRTTFVTSPSLSLRSLTHSLYSTLAFSARGRVITTTARYFRGGEGKRANLRFAAPIIFSAFPSVRPSVPSSFFPSLPPTHLPNRIMQRRKDGRGRQQRFWQHVRPHYQREGRKEGHIQTRRLRKPPHPPSPPPLPCKSPYTNLCPRTINAAKSEWGSGRTRTDGGRTRRRDGSMEQLPSLPPSFLPEFLISSYESPFACGRAGGKEEVEEEEEEALSHSLI